MHRGYVTSVLLIISIVLFLFSQLYAQEEGEIIIISERVGKEIDQQEKEKFKLFQGIKGFQSAVYIKLPDGRYFLKITYLDENSGELKIERIQQSELSIKNRGYYIDHFEEIQARKEEEERGGEIIIISERVGEKIDREERDKYELFQDINGFQSVVFIKFPNNRYILKIIHKNEQTDELEINRIEQSKESINNIKYSIDHFGEIQQQKKFFYSNPGASIYFEFLGKGLYSFNIDYRINRAKAISVGTVYLWEGAILPNIMVFLPNIMFCKFGGGKFKRELGIGLTPLIAKHNSLKGILINGVVGYRYQQKNGLLFRIGFTPLMFIPFKNSGSFMTSPWIGISFGYSL